MNLVQVGVCAIDPITKAGVANCLAAEPDLIVVPQQQQLRAEVVVAAFERLSTAALQEMRASAAEVRRPTVLLINEIKDGDLPTAVGCGVVAILPRAACVDGRLGRAVRSAAAGGAHLPPNLLGQLVEHTERLYREVLEPSGLAGVGLDPREIEVLRLMADGLDTIEIARSLSYSERTVKKIIFAITTRLRARNRPQAVAYALRAGVI
ncbi:response regulator transcription factor [Kribbella antibiotica]|uniref:Response regulator transcription factor n=1 Tax=Kribbella antibiotica TaxID=190195 RepID=A0A4R4ZWC2_9ACTN|nr:response regulator transcription factor [Kribbella antibiotica]TDD61462.1 response regulator transcription factor [Kribbella antibiotica]